ncbi:zinc ribbon domain-containing protein [Alistipes senegalensis]|uniref:zinc ribbon domain-containing protein n=1 Tax=Alistipes senegalensis TaxID=1288121 RepID=UPI00248E065F|nr:zinc ribbon domain-containing protein [Alistipes senegalensis]
MYARIGVAGGAVFAVQHRRDGSRQADRNDHLHLHSPIVFDLVINNYQNTDGSPNEDYGIYCCKDGRFAQDMTMEQMIDPCASSPMK